MITDLQAIKYQALQTPLEVGDLSVVRVLKEQITQKQYQTAIVIAYQMGKIVGKQEEQARRKKS